MSATDWLFDGALGVLLLSMAATILHTRNLYTSIVLFIAFGLLLALTWARLSAPDLALAEAAIGAGLTGALLLSAFARLESTPTPPTSNISPTSGSRPWAAVPFALLVLASLVEAVWPLPSGSGVLPDMAQRHLAASGVEHPVTAVLLNYRAWDTLLELLVLLLALLGVRQLRPARQKIPAPWPLLLAWSKVLAPLAVVIGGYLLWRGAFAPGGAFQAGTLLAAGAIILRLNRLLPPLRWEHWLVRSLVVLGLAVFLLVAILSAWLESEWLQYPHSWSSALIVIIEVAATLSIAATLTLLVVGEKQELGS